MKPGKDNPKGFWERTDIFELNEALLAELGVRWNTTTGTELDTSNQTLYSRHLEAARLIVKRLDSQRPWVAKDPRFCPLFPFWRPLLDQPHIVLVVRHPLEVARSLHTRNRLPLTVGVALWEAYNLAALRYSTGLSCTVVSYNKLLAAPEQCIHDLHASLSSSLESDLRALTPDEIAEVVDSSLFHAHRQPKLDDVFLNAQRKHLYSMLDSGRVPASDLDFAVSNDTQETISIYGRLSELEAKITSLEETNALNTELRNKVAALRTENRRITESLKEELRLELRKLEHSVAAGIEESEGRLARTQKLARDWEAQYLSSQDELTQVKRQLHIAADELSEIRDSRAMRLLEGMLRLRDWVLKPLQRGR